MGWRGARTSRRSTRCGYGRSIPRCCNEVDSGWLIADSRQAAGAHTLLIVRRQAVQFDWAPPRRLNSRHTLTFRPCASRCAARSAFAAFIQENEHALP
jgi:hypothetical protein